MQNEITKITKTKHGFKVFVNDEKIVINDDIYSSYYFYEGKVLTDEELSKIKHEISLISSYQYALKLVFNHFYFKKQIKEKLKEKKKLPFDDINYIINKLEDAHVLNDLELAKDYIEEEFLKNRGYLRIKDYLKKQDINIEDILPYDEDNEYERGLDFLDELVRRFHNSSFDKMKKSIYNSLLVNGYSTSIASKIINNLSRDNFDDKNNLLNDYNKITIRMDEEEILLNKDKIIKKLIAKGYHYNEIKALLED